MVKSGGVNTSPKLLIWALWWKVKRMIVRIPCFLKYLTPYNSQSLSRRMQMATCALNWTRTFSKSAWTIELFCSIWVRKCHVRSSFWMRLINLWIQWRTWMQAFRCCFATKILQRGRTDTCSITSSQTETKMSVSCVKIVYSPRRQARPKKQ